MQYKSYRHNSMQVKFQPSWNTQKVIIEPKNTREIMKIYFREFIVRSYDR